MFWRSRISISYRYLQLRYGPTSNRHELFTYLQATPVVDVLYCCCIVGLLTYFVIAQKVVIQFQSLNQAFYCVKAYTIIMTINGSFFWISPFPSRIANCTHRPRKVSFTILKYSNRKHIICYIPIANYCHRVELCEK